MKYKYFNIKLKAGALQYTIFIAVVIALLVFAFISLSYTQQHFKLKASNFVQVVQNTNLAINYAENKETRYNEFLKLQFSDKIIDNTTIEKKHWGVFDLVTTTSSIKKEIFTKNALLGGVLEKRPSLYLQDDNQPLVLVGNTKIEGNTQLPKQGTKRGTIAGNSYTGSQLIYGNISLSKASLPKLKNEAYLKQLCNGSGQFGNTIQLELEEGKEVVNSFNEQTHFFFSNSTIDLRSIKLTGNIAIRSNTSIRVHTDVSLTDVLLIAPKIEIFHSVEGNFQALATKKIIIGKNCKLKYPSSLVIYEKRINQVARNNDDWNEIQIQSGSEVRGVVGFLSDTKINNYKPQIVLEENSLVIGEVYCSQNVELKGTVQGSVFTKGFIANQFGSIYQNHIYNGKILSTNFPEQYCGLDIEKGDKKVAKWLY